MKFNINEQNPQKRLIAKACEILDQGGVIIYPTDTVYAYGCDINQKKAIEKIYRIKKIAKNKPLSFIMGDLTCINDYANHVSNAAFKIMKKCLPGPYTFILKASKMIPKVAITNQKTIGIRIPDNNIALELVKTLGRPILSASVSTKSGEYIIEPEGLEKEYKNVIDLVIDAGPKISEPSTIIDFSAGDPVIIREGKGEIFF